ncbi:TPA: DUF935 family protein [Escherichia coli]
MGRIIDLDGKPLSFDPEMQSTALDIPQIASRYVEHPASGITPNRAAQCLRGAERGDLIAQSDLAADIEEKDTHLFAELGKRRLAIQGVPWSIEPPPNANANEKKDAEMLDEYLHSADWFDAMLFDATDAILKGYSCMEIEHGMLGKMHIIRAIRWRDSGHFCLNPDDLSELRLRDGSHAGVAFQPFGWIVHQSRSRTGYGGATGLVRTLIWPFIFKNYSVRDLAEFLEVYGLPMKVGKYPSGATPEQKSALMRAVMDIGRRTGGIIPAGMSLEFQAAANGQADPFETMISWGERSISKAILGGTLTTEAGDKGARSLGEVHNEVRREIRDSDLRQLAATLNRDLVYPLYALNTTHTIDIRRLPRICFQTKEPGDITKITSAVMQLSTGMDISDPWISDDTAPAVTQDTAAILEQKSTTALGKVFETLEAGWTVISDGMHDVQAMTETISDKVSALENAVSGMGIVQDISAFTATFTALKGNATALLTAPSRMASSFAGLFSALITLPSLPSLSSGGLNTRPGGSIGRTTSAVSQGMPQLYRTLSSLRYVLDEQDNPQTLIGLTPAAQKNIRLIRAVMQSAAVVAQAQTVGKLLDQVLSQETLPDSDAAHRTWPVWLESSVDLQRINRDLSEALERQVMTLSGQGYTATALTLRDARLALTEDLNTRGVQLPGATVVTVRTTEPALVTLYRATGNSTGWQRFVRRNGIVDPLFIPGGHSVEVISEQQG